MKAWNQASEAAALLIVGLSILSTSCSSKDGEDVVFTSSGGAGGSGRGDNTQEGGNTSGAASSMGTGGSLVVTPPPPATGGAGGGNGGMVDPKMSCAKGTSAASLSPVNMFIQFDRSSSMNDGNKWPQAAQALTGFFGDPQSAGLRVALRFFPHDSPAAGCTSGGCSIDACSQPLVPLAELTKDSAPMDMQEAQLVAGVQNSAPPGAGAGGGGLGGGASQGTPIYAALSGALTWARARRAQAPNEKTVVVLVTDGSPNGCDTDMAHIAQLAADALVKDQILTYAIGIQGASEAEMNQIAVAGGTQHAYFAGNTSTAQQDLIDALNSIRGSTISCDIPMPTGPNVDPALINVTFTPSGGMPETVGQAMGAQNCQNGGWYYDNPAMPAHISLCPSTCARVQADSSGKLDIVLGCKPVPVEPPK